MLRLPATVCRVAAKSWGMSGTGRKVACAWWYRYRPHRYSSSRSYPSPPLSGAVAATVGEAMGDSSSDSTWWWWWWEEEADSDSEAEPLAWMLMLLKLAIFCTRTRSSCRSTSCAG